MFSNLAESNIQTCIATLGETIIFQPVDSGIIPFAIKGIRKRPDPIADSPDDGKLIVFSVSVSTIRARSPLSPARGDKITFLGVTYKIDRIDPADGIGVAKLIYGRKD